MTASSCKSKLKYFDIDCSSILMDKNCVKLNEKYKSCFVYFQYDKEIDSYISQLSEMQIDRMLSKNHDKIVSDKSAREVIGFNLNVSFDLCKIIL